MQDGPDSKRRPEFYKKPKNINRLFFAPLQWSGSILRRFILRQRVVGWMPISAAVADRFQWFRLRTSQMYPFSTSSREVFFSFGVRLSRGIL
jgi:hypothetical protein